MSQHSPEPNASTEPQAHPQPDPDAPNRTCIGTGRSCPWSQARSDTQGKVVFLLIALAMALTAGWVYVSQTSTGSTVRGGLVHLQGEDARAVAQVLLVCALLPLAVWLPRRWLALVLTVWFVAILAVSAMVVFG